MCDFQLLPRGFIGIMGLIGLIRLIKPISIISYQSRERLAKAGGQIQDVLLNEVKNMSLHGVIFRSGGFAIRPLIQQNNLWICNP